MRVLLLLASTALAARVPPTCPAVIPELDEVTAPPEPCPVSPGAGAAAYEIGELALEEVYFGVGSPVARLRTVDGKLMAVSVTDPAGRRGGHVTQIHSDRLVITEGCDGGRGKPYNLWSHELRPSDSFRAYELDEGVSPPW